MESIFLLIEDEPSSDEFPSIVVAAYKTRDLADAALERRQAKNKSDYPEKIEGEDIFLSVEECYLYGDGDAEA